MGCVKGSVGRNERTNRRLPCPFVCLFDLAYSQILVDQAGADPGISEWGAAAHVSAESAKP